jgi:hypothetical protein
MGKKIIPSPPEDLYDRFYKEFEIGAMLPQVPLNGEVISKKTDTEKDINLESDTWDENSPNMVVSEMSIKSELDKGHKSKGHKNLNSFKKKVCDEGEFSHWYEKFPKELAHVRSTVDSIVTLWLDHGDENLVAYICIEDKKNGVCSIQALEVLPDYRGYELGPQLLKYGEINGANSLYVDASNNVAIQMYRNRGWEFTSDKNRGKMQEMVFKKNMVSSVTESAKKVLNDKGKEVPKNCPKCGAPVKIFLHGEPVFLCSNPKCKKYFGTVPCRRKSVKESVDSNKLENLKTPNDVYKWLHSHMTYKHLGKVQSTDETIANGFGDCHDQALLTGKLLKDINVHPKYLFMIEYYDWNSPGGATHSICYYNQNGKIYWLENAWADQAGIHGPYASLSELKHDIASKWPWSGKNDKLYMTGASISPGMTLDGIANKFTPEKAPETYFVRGYEESANFKYEFEIMDNITDLPMVTTELSDDGKLYPVYIMLMHSSTPMANVIKALTNSKFSHSSISFDSSMRNMYSFGRKADSNPFIGSFKSEDIKSEFFQNREVPYALYVVPVTKFELGLMKKRLNYFITNATKFRYDFTGLFKNYFGIADNPEYKYFCSRFVADIINAGHPKGHPYVIEPSLMKPEDFRYTDFAIYVTGGFLHSYNPSKVDAITEKILKAETARRKNSVNESTLDLNKKTLFEIFGL